LNAARSNINRASLTTDDHHSITGMAFVSHSERRANMRTRTIAPWILASLVGLVEGACSGERDAITAPDALMAVVASAPPAAGSVTGSGHYTQLVGSPGWRTFSFTVRRMPDGSVQGRFSGGQHQPTNMWSGRLDCLVIEGNTAWIGGVYEHATNPNLVGTGFVFKVRDVGEGHGSEPDTTSRAMRGSNDCTTKPEPTMHWYAVEEGNIQIHP
jgi:hypothetical protein